MRVQTEGSITVQTRRKCLDQMVPVTKIGSESRGNGAG